MGHHQHPGAVRYQHYLAVDLLQHLLDGLDPGIAVQAVALQRWHRVHLGQARRQQGLPVFGNVLAQAGDDQDSCAGMQFFHVGTYAQDSPLAGNLERLHSHSNQPSPLALYIARQQLFIW
ncbi:hypothetical protein D3C79_785700 [compost metagenome]